MLTAASPTNTEKRHDNGNKKKLTKVLSTKLSIEDYKKFRVLASLAYQYGGIKEDNPSEMLRFLVTLVVNELRNQPGFSFI
jgi:hypothetical protein